MVFKGTNGKIYQAITPPIGQGGEGRIYRIAQMPGFVLKIFKDDKRTEERHRKLLAMMASSTSGAFLKQVTWPVDVVYENGRFAGYIMNEVRDNEDLNVIYSSKYKGTINGKIRIAMNLCAAINSVHNTGQVCGDLNPKNIGVNVSTGMVTLVDADSYHITDNSGRVYRCSVGMPEYLPREIQEKMTNGVNLVSAPLPTFTRQTDLFALAVHIFALLMNGCHPYACAVNRKTNIQPLSKSSPSVTAPQPIENIKNGFFPFQMSKAGVSTPVYAPDYKYLPDKIRELFKRAFVDGHSDPCARPDATDWYNALAEMQRSLTTCKNDSLHMYPPRYGKCPWCELDDNLNKRFKTAPVNKPVKLVTYNQTSRRQPKTYTAGSLSSLLGKRQKNGNLIRVLNVLSWIIFLLFSIYILGRFIFNQPTNINTSIVSVLFLVIISIWGFLGGANEVRNYGEGAMTSRVIWALVIYGGIYAASAGTLIIENYYRRGIGHAMLDLLGKSDAFVIKYIVFSSCVCVACAIIFVLAGKFYGRKTSP